MGLLMEEGDETGRDTSSVNAAFAAMGSAIWRFQFECMSQGSNGAGSTTTSSSKGNNPFIIGFHHASDPSKHQIVIRIFNVDIAGRNGCEEAWSKAGAVPAQCACYGRSTIPRPKYVLLLACSEGISSIECIVPSARHSRAP